MAHRIVLKHFEGNGLRIGIRTAVLLVQNFGCVSKAFFQRHVYAGLQIRVPIQQTAVGCQHAYGREIPDYLLFSEGNGVDVGIPVIGNLVQIALNVVLHADLVDVSFLLGADADGRIGVQVPVHHKALVSIDGKVGRVFIRACGIIGDSHAALYLDRAVGSAFSRSAAFDKHAATVRHSANGVPRDCCTALHIKGRAIGQVHRAALGRLVSGDLAAGHFHRRTVGHEQRAAVDRGHGVAEDCARLYYQTSSCGVDNAAIDRGGFASIPASLGVDLRAAIQHNVGQGQPRTAVLCEHAVTIYTADDRTCRTAGTGIVIGIARILDTVIHIPLRSGGEDDILGYVSRHHVVRRHGVVHQHLDVGGRSVKGRRHKVVERRLNRGIQRRLAALIHGKGISAVIRDRADVADPVDRGLGVRIVHAVHRGALHAVVGVVPVVDELIQVRFIVNGAEGRARLTVLLFQIGFRRVDADVSILAQALGMDDAIGVDAQHHVLLLPARIRITVNHGIPGKIQSRICAAHVDRAAVGII